MNLLDLGLDQDLNQGAYERVMRDVRVVIKYIRVTIIFLKKYEGLRESLLVAISMQAKDFSHRIQVYWRELSLGLLDSELDFWLTIAIYSNG